MPAIKISTGRPGASTFGNAFNSAAVAPHSITTRFSYTVPTGGSVIWRAYMQHQVRAAAATTAAQCFTDVLHRDPGGVDRFLSRISLYGNTVDASKELGSSPNALLPAGTQLFGLTSDASTGGSVTYSVGFLVDEIHASS